MNISLLQYISREVLMVKIKTAPAGIKVAAQ